MSQIDRKEILELIGAIILSIALGVIFFWLIEKSTTFVKILAIITN